MDVRIKYRSAAAAERAAELLPCECRWCVVRDKTSDAYLQVPASYEDYVMRYLNPSKF
jgi:hypothetical protein